MTAGLDPTRQDHFKQVLGHFCTGIVVITATAGGKPGGFTCQSFSSLSLDPPSVVFAPARASETYPQVRAAGTFVANILAERHGELARRFATKGDDRFAGVGWQAGPAGAPVLDAALAWVECELEAEHEAGDHLLVVGRVRGIGHAEEGRPLTYYRGQFGRFEPA